LRRGVVEVGTREKLIKLSPIVLVLVVDLWVWAVPVGDIIG
jgi:hypothetical protein